MNLQVQFDRSSVPAGEAAVRYALVTLQAPPAVRRRTRSAVNVAFVLDRSGSMAVRKLILARQAVSDALRLLHDADRFALVVYNDGVDRPHPSSTASREARTACLRRLAEVEPGGSTDLASGWQCGADEVAAHLDPSALGIVFLLTDGLANVGVTDPDVLAARAAALRSRGVRTSTFGVGADFDEYLLQRMAAAGGGHFYFIERPEQIPDLLASELGETLDVVVRGAAVVVEAPDGVGVVPVGGFRLSAAGRVTRVELGDLVAEQAIALVLKISIAAGAPAPLALSVRTAAEDGAVAEDEQVVTMRPVPAAEAGAEQADPVVVRTVAEHLAAAARMEALQRGGAGHYDEARRILREAADAITALADGNDEALALARALRAEDVELMAGLGPLERKRGFYDAFACLYSRDVAGKARRSTKPVR
jgi:Ca-activated chloride channel family protein